MNVRSIDIKLKHHFYVHVNDKISLVLNRTNKTKMSDIIYSVMIDI